MPHNATLTGLPLLSIVVFLSLTFVTSPASKQSWLVVNTRNPHTGRVLVKHIRQAASDSPGPISLLPQFQEALSPFSNVWSDILR